MILFASYKNAANFLTFPSKQLPSASLSLHPSLPLPFLRTPCPLHLPDVLVRPVSLSSIQEEDRGKSIFSPSCIHYRWVAALVDIVHNPGPRIPILVFFFCALWIGTVKGGVSSHRRHRGTISFVPTLAPNRPHQMFYEMRWCSDSWRRPKHYLKISPR